MHHRLIPAAGISLLLSAGCGAQTLQDPPAPSAPPEASFVEVGDSAAWIEEIDSRMEVITTDDTIHASTRVAAAVHIKRVGPGTLGAFFEALLVRMQSPLGDSRPDTREILRRVFLLEETDSGLVTVQAPGISSEVYRIADIRKHFEEFFPPGFDLSRDHVPGEEWVDTASHTRETQDVSTQGRAAVVRYRAGGDTLWHGIRARAVRYTADVRTTTVAQAGQRGTVESVLEGREQGVILYVPARGLLVQWRRSGDTRGTSRRQDGDELETFPQRYRYEANTRLMSAAAADAAEDEPAGTPAT